jgi:hypothetical protein
LSDGNQAEQRVIREAIDSTCAAASRDRFDQRWYVVWLIAVVIAAGVNANDARSHGKWSLVHAALAVFFGTVVFAELWGWIRTRRSR